MKIAIFNNWPHQYMGGIESYSRVLIEMFLENGWEVTEYFGLVGGETVSKPINGVKQINVTGGKFYNFVADKEFKKVVKSDKYDLIINNTISSKLSFSKNNKIINVQHMDWKWYTPRSADSWFRIFNAIFLRLGYRKNPLKAQNVVFFTRMEDKFKNHNPLYQPTPLKKDFKLVNRKTIGSEIFWLGRFEEPHKGLKNLSKFYGISKHKKNFRVAGEGPDKDKLNTLKDKLIGKVTTKEVSKHFNNSKVYIMTSNYEGFPLTTIEALAHGTPIVMFDSFTSASFYKDCPAVKLIKHKDIKAFDQAVNEIMEMPDKEWLKLSKEATSFAKKHFSQEVFKKNWTKYIKGIYAKSS